MSKTKQLSQYNGTAWETPIDIGADAANVDYPLSDDTTKPLDEVIGSVGASDSNLVTQINGKLSTNGAIDNTVLNQGPDITTYPTSGQVNDGNLVVSAGDSSRTLWSKFNAFRGRVASNFSNYIKATLVTSGTGVSSSATDAQVYSAKAIQNYFNSVIGYNSASDVSSLGSVASQLSSLNNNKAKIYTKWSDLTDASSLTMYQVLQSMEGNSILSMDVTASQITNLKAPGHLIIIRSPTMLTFHKSQIFLSTSTQSDTDITMYIGFCRYDNHAMVWYDSNLANTTIAFMLFKDVTGTTSAGGNITLDLNPATYMVTGLRVGSSSQGIALPWSAGSSWYVRVLNTDGTVKANTKVTIRVEYKKLSF